MNTPWQNPGSPQTAFIQAEGELRQKACSQPENIAARLTRIQSYKTSARHSRPDTDLQCTRPALHPMAPKNNSIPIDTGPAQFNAFYPQCSGQNLVRSIEHSSPEHCG